MNKIFFVFLFVFVFIINAQDNNKLQLTGNLNQDSKILISNYSTETPSVSFASPKSKSPLLAGFMSLIIPGLGEIYSESYWKAAIFAAVEVTTIVVALQYDKKGDDKTNEFQNYADGQWSVVKYAEWLNLHYNENIPIDPNTNLQPWQRVNWNELNAAESRFSHKLPPHGDQQYYELIGKYPQYSSGWQQFNINNPSYHDLPPQFLSYSKMRGEANDFYSVAKTSIIFLYINHFVSALSSAWSAALFNRDFAVNMKIETINLGNKYVTNPTLNFKYSF